MNSQALLLFIISVPNIILGLIVFISNRRSRLHLYFSGFAWMTGLWALGLAGFLLTTDFSNAYMFAQVYYIAATLIAPTFLGFCLSLPRLYRRSRHVTPVRWYMLAPPVVMCVLLIVHPSFMLSEVVQRSWGKEIILGKVGYLSFSIYFAIYVLGSFLVMLRKLLIKTRKDDGYTWYLFAGLIIAFGAGMTFNLVYPFLGNYRYIWAGPLFTLVYVAMTTYSIVWHGFFDIRAVIARTFGYVLALTTLGFLYGFLAFVWAGDLLFRGSSPDFWQRVFYAILAMVLGLTFSPLKRFFDKISNRIFYRDAYDSQELLDMLNRSLVSTLEIEKMLTQTTQVIAARLKPEFCVVGLKETPSSPQRIIGSTQYTFSQDDIEFARLATPKITHKVIVTDKLSENAQLRIRMNRNKIAVLVRLTPDLDQEGIGYIVMGAKKSGNRFTLQDTEVLEIVANSLVIAIQNALRFEEIQQFNLTLQERVERATKQLKRANDKLVTLNDTKDDFISMASHQLRTPLTAVKGNISMVLDGDYGKVTKQLKDPLRQAFNSSERMVGLIADLLNVSRLRTGKFAIQPVSSNLDAVVQSELDQLMETARSRDLKLTYDQPKGFPTLMLDEIKIRQVIMNFIDNAIYYTPPGGQITVTLKHSSKAIEFAVKDSGIGVPRDLQHHLFTKFYRASNAQKMRPDGTGIGLFMAKKVIVASGGSVVFKSVEGKGSTFGFTIPLAKLTDAQSVIVADEPTIQE